MKKILVPLPFEQWGGLHEMVLTIHSDLVKKGFLLIPLIPKNSKFIHNRFRSKKIRTIKANLTRPRKSFNIFFNIKFIFLILRDILLIGRIIKKENIKIVQVSGIQNFHYLIAAKIYKCSLVCQIHSDALPILFRQILSPLTILLSDVIMINGKYIQKKFNLIQEYTKKNKKILFYPGIDISKFAFSNNQRFLSKKILKIPNNNIVIGTIGNQVTAKAHERIIDIIQSFKFLNKINFIILGGSIHSNAKYYKDKVIKPAEKLGLFKNNKLQIIDAKSKINKYLPAFDIFVLTSKYEGIPIALIEAMASGNPVVTTNVGSINEVVKNYSNGFISKNKDFNLTFFKNSLTKLINNKTLKNKISNNNKKLVRINFTIEKLVDKHLKAYQISTLKN